MLIVLVFLFLFFRMTVFLVQFLLCEYTSWSVEAIFVFCCSNSSMFPHVSCVFPDSLGWMGAEQHCPTLPSGMSSSILLEDPSWPTLRSLSSVQSVSFWHRSPSSLAKPLVLTLWYALSSLSLPLSTMSSQLELGFGTGPFEMVERKMPNSTMLCHRAWRWTCVSCRDEPSSL